MDRSFIGWKSSPTTITVEKGMLKLFAIATGEKNPIYSDEEAAKSEGLPGLPVPPTFLMCLRAMAQAEDENVIDLLGIDIGRVLHGEQRFKYLKPSYAGDQITFQTELSDMYEKKGGALQFIVQELTATNQKGDEVAKIIYSFIVR